MSAQGESFVAVIQHRDGTFLEEVNHHTYKGTGIPQQFRVWPEANGAHDMKPLDRDEWVADPQLVIVQEFRLG